MRWIIAALVGAATAAPSGYSEEPDAAETSADRVAPRYLLVNMHHDTQRQGAAKEALQAVVDALQPLDNPRLRVGVHVIYSLLELDVDTLRASLTALLKAAEEVGVPIQLALDGQNWWQTRPDLWNWWDPDLPGYDPANAEHVEWTDWSPEAAVKIGWRNWGRQLRVAPAPNILHPRVIEEHLIRYRVAIPLIAEWHRRLPDDRKHLFAGVKLGWEAGIGYNAFHYPDGNRIYETHPDTEAHDPQTGLQTASGWPCDAQRIGYAAVKTAGIRTEGELTAEDVGEATRRYLETLARSAVELGMPPEHITVHQGGTYAPFDRHLPFSAAFNDYATPGWSFYFLGPEDTPLREAMETAGRTAWAAAEWWWPGQDVDQWRTNLEATLRFMDCRSLVIYNWNRSLERNEAGQEAIRRLAAEWTEQTPAHDAAALASTNE